MYFDYDDNRPETPTIPRAISLREGVLLSLVAHLVGLVAVLVAPDWLPQSAPADAVAMQRPTEPLRFIEVAPLVDRPQAPIRSADASDLDRRAMTREPPPRPEQATPFSRGNTPEPVEGRPAMRAAGPDSQPSPPAADRPDPSGAAPALLDPPAAPAAAPPRPVAGNLGQSLRNLRQYLERENFDNPQGGAVDQGADIQFDSKGIDFGPWLRRFKYQVERNWIVPPAAMTLKGRVVIQFRVLRNGTITDLHIAQPASIEAFTTSALNALKLSNPTTPLPEEYPSDSVFFTVTFHYNDYR